MNEIQQPLLQEALSEYVDASLSVDPVSSLLGAIDRALAQSPGHGLFTALVYLPSQDASVRAYSSRPIECPVGGRKKLADAPRMQKVLTSGTPYIGRNRQDIIDNYPDHQKLLSMGCESVLNMPVHWGSKILGTINLLHGEGHYADSDLELVEIWAQLAVPAFLSVLGRD